MVWVPTVDRVVVIDTVPLEGTCAGGSFSWVEPSKNSMPWGALLGSFGQLTTAVRVTVCSVVTEEGDAWTVVDDDAAAAGDAEATTVLRAASTTRFQAVPVFQRLTVTAP